MTKKQQISVTTLAHLILGDTSTLTPLQCQITPDTMMAVSSYTHEQTPTSP